MIRRTATAALAAFVALEAGAMALYPGGTWYDRDAVGHRFWENFFCDLEQPVTIAGKSNLAGAVLASAAHVVLLVALAAAWTALPRVAPGRDAERARRVGLVSCALGALVPLTPSLIFGRVHAAVVLLATTPGLVAGALALRALFRRTVPVAVRAVTVALLASAAADAALYAYAAATGASIRALPALQKVAAIALVGWIALLAWTPAAARDTPGA